MKDTNSKLTAVHEIHGFVHAPPESVFQILSDINSWPEWQGDIRVYTAGNPGPGFKFKWSDSGMPIYSKITSWKPNHELEWVSKSLWLKSITRWTIEMQEDGTLIHCEVTIEGFGAAMIKPVIAKNMELTMAELIKHAHAVPQPVYS